MPFKIIKDLSEIPDSWKESTKFNSRDEIRTSENVYRILEKRERNIGTLERIGIIVAAILSLGIYYAIDRKFVYNAIFGGVERRRFAICIEVNSRQKGLRVHFRKMTPTEYKHSTPQNLIKAIRYLPRYRLDLIPKTRFNEIISKGLQKKYIKKLFLKDNSRLNQENLAYLSDENYQVVLENLKSHKDYETLSRIIRVTKDSSNEDVKKAFQQAAIKCHPDKGGNGEDMKELNAAYDRICEKREKKGGNEENMKGGNEENMKGGNEENTKELNAAYERICEKREMN